MENNPDRNKRTRKTNTEKTGQVNTGTVLCAEESSTENRPCGYCSQPAASLTAVNSSSLLFTALDFLFYHIVKS